MPLKSTVSSSEKGVSLIEVMVALVIMSIGVLALAGLQLVTKRNTLDAAQRAVASELASDLLERIRHNPDPDALDVYSDFDAGRTLGNSSLGTAEVDSCRGATCTPAQLAMTDLEQWEQSLAGAAESGSGGLINGRACITKVAATGTGIRLEVTIVWRSTVELPDNTAVTCFNSTTLYTSNGGTTNDLRRTFSLDTYVNNRGDFS